MAEDQEFVLPPLEERPLVTFALFAYNQEKYIREAVEGAFAQTYEPLEIILSDDCSTDRTFEIMEEMAKSYSGPHRIRLNRNIINMGISPHVRFIHELSSGQYILHAAGDDISHTERTKKIVLAFLSEKEKPSIVMSNAHYIDDLGNVVGLKNKLEIKRSFRRNRSAPLNFIGPGGGCTLALSRELVLRFSSPNPKMIIEDNLLAVRANLMHGILYIPDILVNYRINHGSASNPFGTSTPVRDDLIARHTRWNQERIYGIFQFWEDAKTAQFKQEDHKELYAKIDTYLSCLYDIDSILNKTFYLSTISLLNQLRKLNREAHEIYVPIPYSQPLKLYVLRWFPLFRMIKNFVLNLSRAKDAAR